MIEVGFWIFHIRDFISFSGKIKTAQYYCVFLHPVIPSLRDAPHSGIHKRSVTLTFYGNSRQVDPPDDPEYDHKDPEYDGQSRRRCHRRARRYASQTQIEAGSRAGTGATGLILRQGFWRPPEGPASTIRPTIAAGFPWGLIAQE
ncbi:hypothetical protein [Aestuariivirga sp.]|uniref:hypothetical protein n=1 Tax=Aestuariivirga sp. TaxID=2650926 RepID=UPI0039E6D7B3